MDVKPAHQSMEERIKVVGAERVLNHIDIPKSVNRSDSVRMLAGLVLIISTQGFGDETDHADFILLTQNRHTRYPSGVIGLGLLRLRRGVCSAALRNFCDASKVGPAAFICVAAGSPGRRDSGVKGSVIRGRLGEHE